MTAPTLDEVDRLIEAWDQRIALADANLVALESEPTAQMLARPGGLKTSLEGVTKQRLGPALEGIDRLFEGRERLVAVVAQAKEQRGRFSSFAFWEKDEHLQAIVDLLEGPSIQTAMAPTPLARRALLGDVTSEVAVTPAQFLAGMARDYEAARDAVAAIARAWARLEPDLEAVEAELGDVRRDAATFPAASSVAVELAAIERELGHERRRVAVDPLGTESSFLHVLRPRVEALRRRVAADRELHAYVDATLAAASTLLEVLTRRHAAARSALAAGLHAPTDPLPSPSDDDSVRGMAPWLETLRKTALEGRWASARIGLDRWMQVARDLRALDDATLGAANDRSRR